MLVSQFARVCTKPPPPPQTHLIILFSFPQQKVEVLGGWLWVKLALLKHDRSPPAASLILWTCVGVTVCVYLVCVCVCVQYCHNLSQVVLDVEMAASLHTASICSSLAAEQTRLSLALALLYSLSLFLLCFSCLSLLQLLSPWSGTRGAGRRRESARSGVSKVVKSVDKYNRLCIPL